MILLLSIAMFLLAPFQTPSTDGFAVRGHVLPANSPAISSAGRVTMTSTLTDKKVESRIAADGSFEFLKVNPGTYRLSVTPGARAQQFTITVSDKNVSDIELDNPRTFPITGSIVVAGGGLLPSFTMMFSPYHGGLGMQTAAPKSGSFKTELEDGTYHIGWGVLPPGYSIQSMKAGSTDLLTTPLTVAGSAVPPITVTLGVSSPPPWVKVSGRIMGLSSSPGVAPRVTLTGSVSLAEPLTAPIQADGTFEFPMVLTGAYTVQLTPSTALTPKNFSIFVGHTNVDDIQIAIPVAKCVQGRAIVEGDGPVPSLNFTLVDPAGKAASATTGAYVIPFADGRFGIRLPEGTRRMTLQSTSLPAGYSLKSFTYGSVDLLREPLRLSAVDNSTFLLTFSATPGSWANVSGHVTGIDPTARQYRLETTDERDVSAMVQPDGTFNLGKLTRGSYTLNMFALGGFPASKPLIVTGRDITAFEFAAPPQKEVVGHVTKEGGNQKNVSFYLILRSIDGVGIGTDYVSTDADGNFKIALPLGENLATISGLSAGAVKSMLYGDTDLLKSPLRVERGDTSELRVTVAAGTTGGALGAEAVYHGFSSCGM